MVRKLPALLLAVLFVLALPACGDDDDKDKSADSNGPPVTELRRARLVEASSATLVPIRRSALISRRLRLQGGRPEPVEQLADALSAFRQAAAEGSCEKLLPLRHSGERAVPPGSAPSQEECANFTQNELDLVRNEVPVGSERFGTAAVVDYTRNGEDVTGLWLLEADGRWRYLLGGGFLTHAVGTRPSQSDQFDEGVNGFLSSAQSRDCAENFRFLDASSPFAAGRTQEQWCEFVRPLYDRPNNFFAQAAANGSAKAQVLGKTRLYGIYEVQLGRDYWILVGKVTPGNTSEAEKQGHIEDGFQAMYSGTFAES